MSLRQTISEEQIKALKNHEEFRLGVLRLLWSAIRNSEIDKKRELTDEEVQAIVALQVKQLVDALKDFKLANRVDLITKTENELEILKSYLPVQLSDQELEKIVKKIVTELGVKDVQASGKIMGLIMKEVKGKADGNRVKEIINKILSA